MSFFILVGTLILETQDFQFWEIVSNYFSNNFLLSHSLFFFWNTNLVFFSGWNYWVDPIDLGEGEWVILFVFTYSFLFFLILSPCVLLSGRFPRLHFSVMNVSFL